MSRYFGAMTRMHGICEAEKPEPTWYEICGARKSELKKLSTGYFVPHGMTFMVREKPEL